MEHTFPDQPKGICIDCGIPYNSMFATGSCPPWSSTVEGENTNAKRTYEAGEVKELKEVYCLLSTLSDYYMSELSEEHAERSIKAIKLLKKLIQKRDTLDRE